MSHHPTPGALCEESHRVLHRLPLVASAYAAQKLGEAGGHGSKVTPLAAPYQRQSARLSPCVRARSLVDGSRVSSYARLIPRIAALVLVVAAVLAVVGLVVTLTRAGEEGLDRGELEAKLERRLDDERAPGEGVRDVRCVLVGEEVSAGIEVQDYECTVAYANGARTRVGARVAGDEWKITRGG